ncbi:MAG: amidohydrolase family protein, partial [Thermoguttaceae bacterium]
MDRFSWRPGGRQPIDLKARWIVTVCGPPVLDAVLRVEDDRIVDVRQGNAGQNSLDLGNVAILPGLVNAHTHLELSGIPAPLGRPGIPFVEWIDLVIGHRRGDAYRPPDAVRQGLAQCARAGVAAVGDILQPGSE